MRHFPAIRHQRARRVSDLGEQVALDAYGLGVHRAALLAIAKDLPEAVRRRAFARAAAGAGPGWRRVQRFVIGLVAESLVEERLVVEPAACHGHVGRRPRRPRTPATGQRRTPSSA